MFFARQAYSIVNLWHRQSLRKKLSYCLVGMTVFPLLLTMAITEVKSDRTLTRLVVTHNRDMAEQTAEDINKMFDEKIKVLRMAVSTTEIRSMVPQQQVALLKSITETDHDIQIATVADIAGNQMSRSDGYIPTDQITYIDRDYFRKMIQSGMTVISDVIIAKSTGYPGIVIAEPIMNEKQQLVGVLIINVNLRAFVERIEHLKIGRDGYAFLVNESGHILLHPDQGMVERRENVSGLAPVMAVMAKQSGLIEYEEHNQKQLAAFSYIPRTGWGLIIQQPLKEALAIVSDVKQTAFAITLLAAFLASLIGIVVASMMTKSIMEIAKAAGRLASGDLDARSQVATQDEIGQLATTFNGMADKLCIRTSALLESEEKYRSLVEKISIGIYRESGDEKSVIAYANPALVNMLGYDSMDELFEKAATTKFWHQEDYIAINEVLERVGMVKNKEIQLCRKNGTALWCSITTTRHYNRQKDMFYLDSVIEDITERKLADEKLHQAYAELERKVAERTSELTALNKELALISLHDSLTSIANRRYFDDFLEREWQRAKRDQTPIALILLDVDFFKLYNDHYGHVAGDKCLRQIAIALQRIAQRATDLVARYGGEEFAIILPDTDQAGAERVGKRILMKIHELAIDHAMSPINEFVTVSLGIAVAIPMADWLPERMILGADQALYLVKNSGRNQMQLTIIT